MANQSFLQKLDLKKQRELGGFSHLRFFPSFEFAFCFLKFCFRHSIGVLYFEEQRREFSSGKGRKDILKDYYGNTPQDAFTDWGFFFEILRTTCTYFST